MKVVREISLTAAVQVWWALAWRFIVFGVIAGFVMGVVVGFVGAAMQKDMTGVISVLTIVVAIVVQIGVLRHMLVGKRIGNYRLTLLEE